jgi:outer membrane protein OmpA-like peptidoglycan-associated protein
MSVRNSQAVAGLLRQSLVGTAVTVAARGFGAADPVASNSSEAGRARNRRVEVVFTTAA